jgi:hypothetical protein
VSQHVRIAHFYWDAGDVNEKVIEYCSKTEFVDISLTCIPYEKQDPRRLMVGSFKIRFARCTIQLMYLFKRVRGCNGMENNRSHILPRGQDMRNL